MSDWIGIISDTHGRLRPEARRALEGCSHLVHAGDVGGEGVLEELRRIAPLSVVRGNTDFGPWAEALPKALTLECLGLRLHLLHELESLSLDPVREKIDIVVYGHTHQPRTKTEGGVLYLNPGSAGPRRPGKPVSLARVWPGPRQPYVESVELFPV